MKLTNLTIKDLITPDAKLTFLVGAGCSVDAPSCLPAGKEMMDALIDYTCVESEVPKIKEIKELRFEQLIEILSEKLDPELKIIDFYGLCDKPNLQHFFLAEMMKQGQFVLTTNFDFLIEHALEQSGVPKRQASMYSLFLNVGNLITDDFLPRIKPFLIKLSPNKSLVNLTLKVLVIIF
ncbi:unnamed protein product [marine sediment metagenome]|uniref:SIR2-like domain-containing protein n=1 Tax=marine sediment metagenome TaxID=412755 RepID=X1CQR1_9ZZZZ